MRLISCTLIVLLLASCGEEVLQKPDDLISQDKMTHILYDLAIINAAKNTNPWTLQQHHVVTMEYLYMKYGIDSAQFANSDIYYASKPVVYQAIYKKVEAQLVAEKDSLEELRRKESDSVRIRAEAQRLAEKEAKPDD